MKPVYASKETMCAKCGDPIEVGAPRVDEVVKRNGRLIRVHRHPPCLSREISEWFENNARILPKRYGRGKVLDISPEQLVIRKRLLSALAALRQYYLPKLNLQGDISTLTEIDLRRFRRFREKVQEITLKLESVGGVPKRYRTAPGVEQDMAPAVGGMVNDWVVGRV